MDIVAGMNRDLLVYQIEPQTLQSFDVSRPKACKRKSLCGFWTFALGALLYIDAQKKPWFIQLQMLLEELPPFLHPPKPS